MFTGKHTVFAIVNIEGENLTPFVFYSYLPSLIFLLGVLKITVWRKHEE
jgi:hypothetical protein